MCRPQTDYTLEPALGEANSPGVFFRDFSGLGDCMRTRLVLTVLVLLAPPILAWASMNPPMNRDHQDEAPSMNQSNYKHETKKGSVEDSESKEVTAPAHAEHKKEETGSRRVREAGHFDERF